MYSGPPPEWREHWFEHDQLLHLAGATSHAAVYFDPDVDEDAARWLLPYLDDVWQYTTHTYGDFGSDPLLYSIFHRGGTPAVIRRAIRTRATTTATSPTAGPARTARATAVSTRWSPTRSRTS